MSDATSLLMRLELESLPSGVSLKDRWREVALLYEEHIENSDASLFYDFHAVLACLYGDKVRFLNECFTHAISPLVVSSGRF